MFSRIYRVRIMKLLGAKFSFCFGVVLERKPSNI